MIGDRENQEVFRCSKCGICCEHIDLIAQLQEYDMGNGVCKYLTEDRLCAIYEHRPDICNVEKMYEKQYCNELSRAEYYRLNAQGCRKLKSIYGVGNEGEIGCE